MSSAPADLGPEELSRVQNRVLDLYTMITVLMLIGIGVLVLYAIHLGSLTSPGAQESFGLAVGLMFVMAAVIVHTVDFTYRVWPLGRRFHPTPPGLITDLGWARFLRIITVVIVAAALAYILGTLIVG